jgi:hypothetical protein
MHTRCLINSMRERKRGPVEPNLFNSSRLLFCALEHISRCSARREGNCASRRDCGRLKLMADKANVNPRPYVDCKRQNTKEVQAKT